MFGVTKREKKTKVVKTEVQKEAACHAQVLKIQNAVREANKKRQSHPPDRIYINGWFYKIIHIDVKKLLKKKKTQKPIEAEFHSPEQYAEIEKARGRAELEKMKHYDFWLGGFFRL